ncbi:class I SAM-dependent methyltransferase [Calidifontibacter sp. DB0510]|uniref:Class I SAM-dependent methyltransferase n=1 Tax=Metallococcus carri TaxID=1656884 RepID=A0A967B3P6_9MICO|nr:class I SAM-dependent methyltransferase [Metallococcus carri]NHN57442.1 class I SAM-dependent methyltransferase [Metallococcus carri]NOP39162.1 methyltransferase domain-containing protein [Calidifontibacter sp. DB2511S]
MELDKESLRLSFGAGAADYDRVRPRWTGEALSWLAGAPSGAIDVLDLGCGTGIGARTLADLGHRVVAVDPDAGMLSVLRAEAGDRLRVEQGSAERIPLPDNSVDAVVVLQAWHWFDPEVAAVEVARVLRPAGVLGAGWNVWDSVNPWLGELAEAVEEPWRMHADEEDLALDPLAGFGPWEGARFANPLRQSVNDFVAHMATLSWIATHPERDRLLGAARGVAERAADADGMVDFPQLSRCARTRRAA